MARNPSQNSANDGMPADTQKLIEALDPETQREISKFTPYMQRVVAELVWEKRRDGRMRGVTAFVNENFDALAFLREKRNLTIKQIVEKINAQPDKPLSPTGKPFTPSQLENALYRVFQKNKRAEGASKNGTTGR
jgi:hypothetical protein